MVSTCSDNDKDVVVDLVSGSRKVDLKFKLTHRIHVAFVRQNYWFSLAGGVLYCSALKMVYVSCMKLYLGTT